MPKLELWLMADLKVERAFILRIKLLSPHPDKSGRNIVKVRLLDPSEFLNDSRKVAAKSSFL